jgi:hypothetical protein
VLLLLIDLIHPKKKKKKRIGVEISKISLIFKEKKNYKDFWVDQNLTEFTKQRRLNLYFFKNKIGILEILA